MFVAVLPVMCPVVYDPFKLHSQGFILIHKIHIVLIMGILHAGGHVAFGELLSRSLLLPDHIADVIFGIRHVGPVPKSRSKHIEAVCRILLFRENLRHIFNAGKQSESRKFFRIIHFKVP